MEIKEVRQKRVLINNEDEQKYLEENASAASSAKTYKFYLKSFLRFNNQDEDYDINSEMLSDNNCAAYIAVVWNSVPHVGPATIRGNLSHIFFYRIC